MDPYAEVSHPERAGAVPHELVAGRVTPEQRPGGAPGGRAVSRRDAGDAEEGSDGEGPRVGRAVHGDGDGVPDAGLQRLPRDHDHGAAIRQATADRGAVRVDDAVVEGYSVAGERVG